MFDTASEFAEHMTALQKGFAAKFGATQREHFESLIADGSVAPEDTRVLMAATVAAAQVIGTNLAALRRLCDVSDRKVETVRMIVKAVMLNQEEVAFRAGNAQA